jgi:hypothetical protein
MTLKNTILTMDDDELGYEMYSKKVALQLSFKQTKRLQKFCLDHLELQ